MWSGVGTLVGVLLATRTYRGKGETGRDEGRQTSILKYGGIRQHAGAGNRLRSARTRAGLETGAEPARDESLRRARQSRYARLCRMRTTIHRRARLSTTRRFHRTCTHRYDRHRAGSAPGRRSRRCITSARPACLRPRRSRRGPRRQQSLRQTIDAGGRYSHRAALHLHRCSISARLS